MHPVLFHVYGVPVPSYGIMFLAGVLLGVLAARLQARALGVDPGVATDFLFTIVISGFVAAKLLDALVVMATHGAARFDLLSALRGGGVWYGGFLGGLCGGAVLTAYKRLSFWRMTDIAVPGVILALAVGRVGCFLAGCCYGAPTSLPMGVVFTDPFSARTYGTPLGTPLHPVQLYEAAVAGLIAVVLFMLSRREGFAGRVVPVYLILYAPARFLLEFLRGDARRGVWFGGLLSTSQMLSAGVLVLGVALYLRNSRRGLEPRGRARAGGAGKRSPQRA